MPIKQCPKCAYIRQVSDEHCLPGICPQCGIVYAKWIARQEMLEQQNSDKSTLDSELEYEQHYRLSSVFKELFFYVPESTDSFVFWGRATLFGVFFIWGWLFILGGVDWESIGGSFLHNVILPFHEFGHVLFSPFGQFMMIIGGSLFQVLMPLGIMILFTVKQRDNFSASIMLWWSGQSFIDVSPYIADAPYRAIPLIRGLGEESHDWGNLLTMTGTLNHASTFAHISFGIGTCFILLSFVWGAYILYLQKQSIEN